MHHFSCSISVIHQLQNRGCYIIILSDSISTDFMLLSSVGSLGWEEGERGEGRAAACDPSPAEVDTNGQTHLCSTKSRVVTPSWIKRLFVHWWNQLVIPRSNSFQLKWHLTTDLTECFKRVCLLKTTHCYRVMQELSVSTKMLRHVGCLWIERLWTIFNFSFYFSFTPVFVVCLILEKKL